MLHIRFGLCMPCEASDRSDAKDAMHPCMLCATLCVSWCRRFMRNDLEHARSMYQEAMGAEADCLEAIYNLGVVNKRLGEYPTALGLFEKLHTIIPNSVCGTLPPPVHLTVHMISSDM